MRKLILPALAIMMIGTAHGQDRPPPPCDACAAWNVSQAPFRLYGNSWYVGVHGLSSVLITSDKGHILIDGDLPESAPKVADSIRSLGFRVEDIKLILNSHVHYDHAGGIAELQRLSGAKVAASALSAKVLTSGKSGRDDPQ
jgi:metallo-beta-lactamase class B